MNGFPGGPPPRLALSLGDSLAGMFAAQGALAALYRRTVTGEGQESGATPVDVVQVLKDTKADVLVSYLPVGSEQADKFYAQCAIDAGVDGTHPDLCAAAVFCHGTPIKTVQNVKVIGRQDVAQDPVLYVENQISTDSTTTSNSGIPMKYR